MLFVLNVVFQNSDNVSIYSDLTWQGRQGSIIHDSVYNGELVDDRNDRPGWAQVGFNDSLSLWITPELMPATSKCLRNWSICFTRYATYSCWSRFITF